MIQANELRIGNYIFQKNIGIAKVISISSKVGDYESVFVECLKDELDYDFNLDEEMTAIPLTKEVLLCCGFKQYKNVLTTYKAIITTYQLSAEISILAYLFDDRVHSIRMFQGKSRNSNMLNINALHQYQNLYFALTGKELEIDF